MSIYSLNFNNVSRAKGGCSIDSLSYGLREKIYCPTTQTVYDNTEQNDFICAEFLQPPQSKFSSAIDCFNSLEEFEKSANARLAKKVRIVAPEEFSTDFFMELLKSYCNDNFVKNGYCVNIAIHDDPTHHNPHAHILITNRIIDKNGAFGSKRKCVYSLDPNGEKIPIIDKATGEQKRDKKNRLQWKRENVSVNLLDQKEFLLQCRKDWADKCNEHLPADKQISHLSLEAQGIQRLPTIHEGYQAQKRERQGLISPKCEFNRNIEKINRSIKGTVKKEAWQEIVQDYKTTKANVLQSQKELVKPHDTIFIRLKLFLKKTLETLENPLSYIQKEKDTLATNKPAPMQDQQPQPKAETDKPVQKENDTKKPSLTDRLKGFFGIENKPQDKPNLEQQKEKPKQPMIYIHKIPLNNLREEDGIVFLNANNKWCAFKLQPNAIVDKDERYATIKVYEHATYYGQILEKDNKNTEIIEKTGSELYDIHYQFREKIRKQAEKELAEQRAKEKSQSLEERGKQAQEVAKALNEQHQQHNRPNPTQER